MQLRKITRFLPQASVILVLLWAVGLSLGIYAGSTSCTALSLFLRASCYRQSFFIVPAALLPITLVWIVCRHSMPGLIFPILFLKAFFDGFILFPIASAFGSATWLMGVLVFFSDRIATVFLIYFSVLCSGGNDHHIDRWYFTFLFLIIVIYAIDYFFISSNLISMMP